jgi:dTDP-4-amino-4,6-dideoxygalactose transaminase
VDPETLDYDPQALEQALRDDVLAVVAAGLYGMPADVVAVRARAEVFGCHVVDDAAQSFGGEIDGRPCGGHGDFGVTSFSKGKGLSTFEGGAILSSNAGLLDKVATLLAEETERPYGAMAMIVRSAGYAAFQRPRLYGLVHRISMLELGRSVFDPTFGIGTFTEFQAALGLEALARSTNVVNARRNRAAGYQALLEDVPGLKMPRVHHRAKPAWTRFPLLLDDPDRRQALLAKLTEQGLGASASYPEALGSLHELQPYFSDSSSGCYPGAQRIARTIITLPTHSAVLAAEQERIRDILLWGMKSSTQKTMRL